MSDRTVGAARPRLPQGGWPPAAALPSRRTWRPGWPPPVGLRRIATAAALLGAACLVGAAITITPSMPLLLGLAAVLLTIAVAVFPALGVYLLLGITPLIAGIDRGMAIPVLRPNEALLVLVALGLSLRGIVRATNGFSPRLTLDAMDLPLLLLAFASSVLPLLWMLARRQAIEQDDLLYALMLWKYYGIFLVARICVRTERQARNCLGISVVVACVVAVIAVLQSLQLFGVTRILLTYYAPYGDTGAILANRGGSTLSLPIAVADLMTFNLAIVIGFLSRRRGPRVPLLAAGAVLVAGVLASAEFSGAIGLVLGLAVMAIVTRRVRALATFIPVFVAAGYGLRPVIARRLEGFGSASGLPESWSGRLHNLSNYFLPKLLSDGNFILGVRPAARVSTSTMSLGYIWIESGYIWLLWSGGIPLLLAFAFFLWVALRRHLPLTRSTEDILATTALAVVVALIVIGVLMLIDPHLTYRGSADLLFVLLGLVAALTRPDRTEGAVGRRTADRSVPSSGPTASQTT